MSLIVLDRSLLEVWAQRINVKETHIRALDKAIYRSDQGIYTDTLAT
jgi:hypothetical protein